MRRPARSSIDCPAPTGYSRRMTRSAPSPYFPEDGTVGWYDTEHRTRVGPGVELGHGFDYMASGHGRVLVAEFDDGVDGDLLQGVDLDAGRLVPPTIDGRRAVLELRLPSDRTRSTRRSKHGTTTPCTRFSGATSTPAPCSRRHPASRTSPPAAGSSLPAPLDGRIYELDPDVVGSGRGAVPGDQRAHAGARCRRRSGSD